MFLYLAAFVGLWAITGPQPTLRPIDPEAIPGSFPDLPESVPIVLSNVFVQGMRACADWTRRGAVLATLFYCAVMLAGLLASLSILVPILGVSFILWFVGPVAVASSASIAVVAVSTAISTGIVVLAALWIPCVSYVITFAVQDETSLELAEKALESLVRSTGLVEDQGEVFWLNGNAHSLAQVREDAGLPIGFRFAVLSKVVYSPFSSLGARPLLASVLMLVYLLTSASWVVTRFMIKRSWWVFKLCLILCYVVFTADWSFVSGLADWALWLCTLAWYPLFIMFREGSFQDTYRLYRSWLLVGFLRMLNTALWINLLTLPSGDVPGLAPKRRSWRAHWTQFVMTFQVAVDKIALPEFVRSLPDRFDAEGINATQAILEELGWPAAPAVSPDQHFTGFTNYPKYCRSIIGGTSIRQGLVNVNLKVAKELSHLRGLAPQYKRAEQFATLEAEIDSLARYFEQPTVESVEVPVEDIWEMVWPIYKDSKLTPFNHILKKWEKKYGLGPFWGKVNPKTGKWSKLSRRDFIKSIGGMANMVELWARTFEKSTTLVPVSPVSVKSEALPPKKWERNIVRTVVGSPIVHYILSTIWNYGPNHNFKFWSTSIKIGMPLNGFNISKLVAQHDRYDNHFAGDFENFDSKVTGPIVKIIRQVRKKGFEKHRDFAKICFLIDANYESLIRMPLMTTSTGNIYAKETGLSTGHSSTSPDNSLAVVILYIAAWRKVTGLSASEFRHFCKLSNYGDDHMLSWLASTPKAWNKKNIIRAMADFGVTLKDEEPSGDLLRFTFLSKGWRKPTAADRLDCKLAGVDVPAFIVTHDSAKLLGKVYAPSRDYKMDRMYRAKRLISYLDLCAFQRENYDRIRLGLENVLISNKGVKLKPPIPIPTYEDVVRKWLRPEANVVEEDEENDAKVEILDYSHDGVFDGLVRVASVIPDFINPAIYNIGYTNYLLRLLGDYLTWPIHLLKHTNAAYTTNHLVNILRKTPYDFLSDAPRLLDAPCEAPIGSLLMKHWLFLAFRRKSSIWSGLNVLLFADSKIASANFVLNGYVQPMVRRMDLPWLDIMLIALISFVPTITVPAFICQVHCPSFSDVVESATGVIINTLWSKVPANMKQVYNLADQLSGDYRCLAVTAPTGTGKSTTLVRALWNRYCNKYTKIILVEPRTILVPSLCDYLDKAFGLPGCPVTFGYKYDGRSPFIITTPAEVLLHTDWWRPDNLFIIDESHLMEPLHIGVQKMLQKLAIPRLLLSATLSEQNIEDADVMVDLSIARTWAITDTAMYRHPTTLQSYQEFWPIYKKKVLEIVNANFRGKMLVFVIDLSQAEDLAQRLNKRTCVLTSKSKVVDAGADVYISTSVGDVGLTLPDVAWVVTSNLTRQTIPDDVMGRVALVTLDNATLQQRRGRTGRTNNCFFSLISFDCAFASRSGIWPSKAVGAELLKSGIPGEVVAKFFPETVTALFGRDYDRSDDFIVDSFARNYDAMLSVTDGFRGVGLMQDLDNLGLHDIVTASAYSLGSTQAIGATDPLAAIFGTTGPRPLLADQFHRIAVGISARIAYAAEEAHLEGRAFDAHVTAERIKSFFRQKHISFSGLFEALTEGWLDENDLDGTYLDGVDEFVRFGKTTALPEHMADSDAAEDAPYFDNA
ncbi:polyprotein [Auricularia heimuer fusarivirus 1]|uniref:Polyprotein n=1 Tax=Auricularia heimuer fusarivirus 1 TaxID=2732256 RepID=A0ABX6N344_9VIRU|nr:polyprotein [Auricularia heimuer fusarivirus 1]QJP04102.1 polyprotein [Auricularia heimuer fusarivirus 1]